MDAKEAIKALNTGIAEAKQHYERRKDEDDIIMIELFSVCVEALEKVPVLEAENARFEKYNNTLIADNNLLRNELDAQDLLSHEDDIELVEMKHKMEHLEAENARLGHLLALANQELEKHM